MTLCLFFGCWNAPSHGLWSPGGGRCGLANQEAYDLCNALDAGFAPRVTKSGKIVFGETRNDARDWDRYSAVFLPDGRFLRHRHGRWTLLQWWDRSQGDGRNACNSSILLEGDRTTEEVLSAGRLLFPHVFENLEKAGVDLVEVFPSA